MHGTGDVEAKDASMLMRKAGLKTKAADAAASDKALEEERQNYTREGKKEHGFASSVVPTIEEKFISEQNQNSKQNGRASHNGDAHDGGGKLHSATVEDDNDSPEPRADGELFGVPANGDVEHDDEVPGPSQEVEDSNAEEDAAVDARDTIRRSMGARLSNKPSALPTPAPHVDPHGFDDPISEEFWKKTWLACAVHNVSPGSSSMNKVANSIATTDGDLQEGIPCHP